LETRVCRSLGGRVSSQHLAEELVGHAAFDELFLGQNAVVVLVHLGEDLLRPLLGRVARIDVSQRRSHHVVDCLHAADTDQTANTIKYNGVARSSGLGSLDPLKICREGSGVGVRLKVRGVNIEKTEGVGCGEGLCPPQLGVWELAPRKKNNFALKVMQF